MSDEKNDTMNVKNDTDFLANASMTESYSEILNSPTTDTNVGHGIESSKPIVITKRKHSPLSRRQSSQCKFSIYEVSPKCTVIINSTQYRYFSLRNF